MPDPLLFDTLGPVERAAISERLGSRQVVRGQRIFVDGDIGDCLFVVRSGRLGVQVATAAGQMVTLRVVNPGEVVGEVALVHRHSRRTGTLIALEDASLSVLRRNDFEEIRQLHPGVDRFLVGLLAERLAYTSALAVEMMLPPEERIFRRLVVLADAYAPGPIRISQEVLAQAAGTVRQTANKVLTCAARDGVIELSRGAVRVLDRRAADRLAGILR